jgi:hypothetical protein
MNEQPKPKAPTLLSKKWEDRAKNAQQKMRWLLRRQKRTLPKAAGEMKMNLNEGCSDGVGRAKDRNAVRQD